MTRKTVMLVMSGENEFVVREGKGEGGGGGTITGIPITKPQNSQSYPKRTFYRDVCGGRRAGGGAAHSYEYSTARHSTRTVLRFNS